jgi:hypothetical protein
MTIHAYVLAAEPAWIEASIRSYYGIVDRIIVSYDRSRRGWTGAPIPVDECLDRLRAVDPDRKMRLSPGDYARTSHSPMENDTHQRLCAAAEAGEGADWVLAIDTDEVFPDGAAFGRRLVEEVPRDYAAVDWPMRPFFRLTEAGVFLEVCTPLRRQVSEYPGCVAIRPGTLLTVARHTDAPRWRFDVRARGYDRVERRPYEVHRRIDPREAILHFSWARTEADLVDKLTSWSHRDDFDPFRYLQRVWRPSPRRWPLMSNFHPIWPRRWPALRPVRLDPRLTDRPPVPTGPVAVGEAPAAAVAEGPRA